SGREGGRTQVAYTRDWLEGCSGQAQRRRWYEHTQSLAGVCAGEDPRRRVAWGGPDMSVRSCISARQMETWSHGQAVFDLLGLVREDGDRLRNIVVMGVNTFGWSFVTNGLEVPADAPRVQLRAPSGDTWQWNTEQADNLIAGSAVEFCQVVTQTRNVADTELEVQGDIARQWMTIAQCFAGPPEPPPPPGTRFRIT
ncbi:MAG: maleylpyruvate isomerase family mycothiol-dependent enzyme, partial [Parahaliea sp.]